MSAFAPELEMPYGSTHLAIMVHGVVKRANCQVLIGAFDGKMRNLLGIKPEALLGDIFARYSGAFRPSRNDM